MGRLCLPYLTVWLFSNLTEHTLHVFESVKNCGKKCHIKYTQWFPIFFYLYIIYCLFNDSADSSDCIASKSTLFRNEVKNNNVRSYCIPPEFSQKGKLLTWIKKWNVSSDLKILSNCRFFKPGMQKFFKNLEAASRLQNSEWWNKGSSIRRTHKH